MDPVLLHIKRRLDPQTITTTNRIVNISGYGYQLSSKQIVDLDRKYKAMRRILGRIPALWHDPEIGVNRNQLTFTEDFSNAAWTKSGTCTVTGTNVINLPAVDDRVTENLNSAPGGSTNSGLTYTISCEMSGTGTVSLMMQDITSGNTYTQSFTLTGTPTRYSFTKTFVAGDTGTNIRSGIRRVTGDTATQVTANKIMTERGSTASDYNPKLNNAAVKSLNLGSAGASGDGTFTNGSSITMIDLVGTRRVFKAVRASTQSITTTYAGASAGSGVTLFEFLSRASTNDMSSSGYGTTAAAPNVLIRPYRSTSSPPQEVTTVDGVIARTSPSNADIGNNVWHSASLSKGVGNSTSQSYQNGLLGGTNAAFTLVSGTGVNWNIISNGGGAYDGLVTHVVADHNSYSDAVILALHNALKTDVGL